MGLSLARKSVAAVGATTGMAEAAVAFSTSGKISDVLSVAVGAAGIKAFSEVRRRNDIHRYPGAYERMNAYRREGLTIKDTLEIDQERIRPILYIKGLIALRRYEEALAAYNAEMAKQVEQRKKELILQSAVPNERTRRRKGEPQYKAALRESVEDAIKEGELIQRGLTIMLLFLQSSATYPDASRWLAPLARRVKGYAPSQELTIRARALVFDVENIFTQTKEHQISREFEETIEKANNALGTTMASGKRKEQAEFVAYVSGRYWRYAHDTLEKTLGHLRIAMKMLNGELAIIAPSAAPKEKPGVKGPEAEQPATQSQTIALKENGSAIEEKAKQDAPKEVVANPAELQVRSSRADMMREVYKAVDAARKIREGLKIFRSSMAPRDMHGYMPVEEIKVRISALASSLDAMMGLPACTQDDPVSRATYDIIGYVKNSLSNSSLPLSLVNCVDNRSWSEATRTAEQAIAKLEDAVKVLGVDV